MSWEDKCRRDELAAEYTSESVLEVFWDAGQKLGRILGTDFFKSIYERWLKPGDGMWSQMKRVIKRKKIKGTESWDLNLGEYAGNSSIFQNISSFRMIVWIAQKVL